MKSTVLACALAVGISLVGNTGGHPVDIKRDLVTEVVFVTETVADAIVYVDENGVPYLTTKVDRVTSVPTVETTSIPPIATPIPDPSSVEPAPAVSVPPSSPTPDAPTSKVSSELPMISEKAVATPIEEQGHTSASFTPVTPPSSPVQVPPAPPSQAPKPVPSSPAPAPAAPPRPTTQSDQFPLGITYDPYTGSPGPQNTKCKSSDQIVSEFEQIKDYGIVRIYGNDCGMIPIAFQQAKKNGQMLMGGIYTPSQNVSEVVTELKNAVDQYNGGSWDIMPIISVENERVQAGVYVAEKAQGYLQQAKSELQSTGYSGLVGAVETVPALVTNTPICNKADVALVNIHAFFDTNTKAEDAGTFVQGQIELVKKACPNKRVIVTESGWPHQGTSHDQAVVSPDAQKAAIASIRDKFKHDLFLFSAFDTPWKTDDEYTWNAERYWGIM